MRQAMDDNPEHGVARLLELTDNLEHGVTRLLELIRWLALPYVNEPIFASQNWDGSPIESGERLQATWRAVIGETGQVTAGAWMQCPECKMWQVASADPIETGT